MAVGRHYEDCARVGLGLLVAGCAAPPATPYTYQPAPVRSDVAVKKSEAASIRQSVGRKRAEQQEAKLQDEIERLEAEIDALEDRAEALEKEVAAAEGRSYVAPSRTVYTGPRGGRYTISPSGKKVYQRRK